MLAVAVGTSRAQDSYGAPPPDIKERLDRLVRAYPDSIAGVEGEHLVLGNGTRLKISDGRNDKSFDELLE